MNEGWKMDNKLVLELAKASGFGISGEEVFSPYIEGETINDCVEALIALVAEECCDAIVNNGGFWSSPHDRDAIVGEKVLDIIRSHFGVE
jgi:hypothetical protein